LRQLSGGSCGVAIRAGGLLWRPAPLLHGLVPRCAECGLGERAGGVHMAA
jgi:hypothetical protein